jgi:alpha-amylase
MDYETFGEHQWKETGIFQFLKSLPHELSSRGVEITTVEKAASENSDHGTVSVENPISWADTDRNLNAWLGNAMQNDAFNAMKTVYDTDAKTWRLLQTSDHIYYMSVRNFADQDVHSYFNPYLSPYLAFIYYMAILDDLKNGRV